MTKPGARIGSLVFSVGLAACQSGEPTKPAETPTAPVATSTPAASTDAARPASPTAVPVAPSAPSVSTPAITFDADMSGAAPSGFKFGRTGTGAAGRWVVRAEADAPSAPNVLAQLDTDDTSYRFPVAVADAPLLRDLRLSVRCKSVSGRVDQACGLVFRYFDEDNYFITRSNPLENNIRLYTVKNGKRKEIASWSGTVTAAQWHEYAVEARGDHIQVFWDGQRVLDHHDATISEPGRVGLWTKADSVTYFDDLSVTALDQSTK